MLFPNEQPVGLDVTFPFTLVVACQDVCLILLIKSLTTKLCADNGPQFIKWETAFFTALHVTLELDGHLQLVLIHSLSP